MMKKMLSAVWMLVFVFAPLDALELVRDGTPVAEIVVDPNACNSTKTAAQELQKYLEKMSGAKLPIVNRPGKGTPVYVGPGEFTEKLGIKTSDIRYDGFKIIVNDRYAAIVGVDANRPPIPRCNTSFSNLSSGKVLKEWQDITGKSWNIQLRFSRDPRNARFGDFTKPLSFHTQDATGTLYGVYDFLERLGCRFFMPDEELGFVIPEKKTVIAEKLEVKSEPAFAFRSLMLCGRRSEAEFFWFKQLRQGGMYDPRPEHSSSGVASLQKDRSELFIHINGRQTGLPRLSSPELRTELADYTVKLKAAYPETVQYPIGQPDGWLALDDRDVAAGWDKIDSEGSWGRFSDYVWNYVIDVAKQVRTKHPGLQFNTLSYGFCKNPPKNIDKIPGDIGIYITQNSTLPDIFPKELPLRKEWEKKAPDSELFIYDYYLAQKQNSMLPVPVIFVDSLKKNLQSLSDQYKGTYVEIMYSMDPKSPTRVAYPGLNHLMYYLHGKLTWDKKADVNAILQDYYEKFFGPAAPEMKEFYEFAESVWSRPDARQITKFSGFLKPEDVDRYFSILERARAKAGDTIYGKRIAYIEKEMEPLKKVFVKMNRIGPFVRVRTVLQPMKFTVDGDLSKPLWASVHKEEHMMMKENLTGAPQTVNRTRVAFRWVNDSLMIGITCYERSMDKIVKTLKHPNDDGIWNNDNVELFVETPEGYNIKMAVNPDGILWCRASTPDVTDVVSAWRPTAVAVKQYPDRWTMEIQLKGIGKMPTRAIPWGINVCRQRMADGKSELSALSPTGGKFGNSEKMASLWSNGK